MYPNAVLKAPVKALANASLPKTVLVEIEVLGPLPTVIPLTDKSLLNDLSPAIISLELKSTKFLVAEPVPPWSIANAVVKPDIEVMSKLAPDSA